MDILFKILSVIVLIISFVSWIYLVYLFFNRNSEDKHTPKWLECTLCVIGAFSLILIVGIGLREYIKMITGAETLYDEEIKESYQKGYDDAIDECYSIVAEDKYEFLSDYFDLEEIHNAGLYNEDDVFDSYDNGYKDGYKYGYDDGKNGNKYDDN